MHVQYAVKIFLEAQCCMAADAGTAYGSNVT